MGQTNNKQDYRYSIPVNTKLVTSIEEKLAIKKSPDEVSLFKKFMKKRLKNEFTPSFFTEKFHMNDSGIGHVSSLINLIYTKNTNTQLKVRSNRTLYEAVFNYDIVEKESKAYDKFSKNMISAMRNFIEGEDKEMDNTLRLSEDMNKKENYLDNEEMENKEEDGNNSYFDKASGSKIRGQNNLNDDTDNDNFMQAFQDIKDDKNNSKIGKGNQYGGNNLNELGTIKLTEDSFRDKEDNLSNDRKNSQTDSVKLHFYSNKKNTNGTGTNKNKNKNNTIFLDKSKMGETKKKHKKNPKKAPLVNIKINLKDIIKQDVYETSTLDPKDRFKTNKSKSPPKQNAINKSTLNDVNNLTTIKADVSQVNINDGSFLEIVDCLVQPNKKESDRIHSRTPKRKNNANKVYKSSEKNQTLYKSKVYNSKNMK